jgi:hypothetical protein
MSVPLDNLYHWVEGLLPSPAIVYVFRPHGSKNISDITRLKIYNNYVVHQFPAIIMHDQEPLDWNFYNYSDQYKQLFQNQNYGPGGNGLWLDSIFQTFCNLNLKSATIFRNSMIYDQDILIHSEKNSKDLELYQQNGFETVHYWAHAIIARDWYRFAEHDSRLCADTPPKNKFLIYCRDWSHRREYRLKFLELLIQNNLDQASQINVMHTNSENVHFSQHQFCNTKFKINNLELISNISANTFPSSASADYNYLDFVESEISVVLETVFDDSRIHLTEKTLRPIACGHPFILAAGPGSLEYIRSYGFKTFAPWIDECYDLETDSVKRLEKIIVAMKKIQNLQGSELEKFSQNVKDIADFNKKHFFSNEFVAVVRHELQDNLNQACQMIKKTRGKYYLRILKLLKIQKINFPPMWRKTHTLLVRQLRQSYPHDQSSARSDPLA